MTTCAAPTCDRPPQRRGYCWRHYEQIRRHGRLTPEREHVVGVHRVCSEPDCHRPHLARGLCDMHYTRRWRAARRATTEESNG